VPPLLANYYLTYKCNSRCTYCDIPIKPVNIPIRESAPELIIENLAALKRLGVKVVDFTGGEPLIYKHLPQVLRAAKDMGFLVSLANTGTLYPRVAKDIAGLVDDLKFSLSTTDADAYKAERGIDGYKKVIESIKLAQSLGEEPSIISTATPQSLPGMEKVVKLAQELGIIMYLQPVFDYCENETLRADGIEQIKKLAKYDNVDVNWAFMQFYLDGGNQISKPRCRAVSAVVVVSPDDHLLLPCYHMHDERLKIQHENGRSNLDELWRSPPVQEKRKKEGSWDFCQGCTIWCYFEPSFYWPPDRYFFLHMKSKAQWAKQILGLKLEQKSGLHFGRRLAPAVSSPLAEYNAGINITATSARPSSSSSQSPASLSAGAEVEAFPGEANVASLVAAMESIAGSSTVDDGNTIAAAGFTVTPVSITQKSK
jgi:MoaA/NifB/PqqE/SkfB family radical SAM enzyme